jgi:hypothetical protein
MSTTTAEAAKAWAQHLADVYEGTVWWRNQKAEQYPDDSRNIRCANALAAAVDYLRSLERPDTKKGLMLFVGFEDQLETSQFNSDRWTIISSDGPAVARFFFDRGSGEPTDRDFDRLIVDTFYDTLRGWRDSIESGDMQPPGDLVRFFDEHHVPLWEDDDGDEE